MCIRGQCLWQVRSRFYRSPFKTSEPLTTAHSRRLPVLRFSRVHVLRLPRPDEPTSVCASAVPARSTTRRISLRGSPSEIQCRRTDNKRDNRRHVVCREPQIPGRSPRVGFRSFLDGLASNKKGTPNIVLRTFVVRPLSPPPTVCRARSRNSLRGAAKGNRRPVLQFQFIISHRNRRRVIHPLGRFDCTVSMPLNQSCLVQTKWFFFF